MLPLLLALTGPALAAPELVYDRTSDSALFGSDATRPWHPASLTKMMTAYVALAAVADGKVTLDTPVEMTLEASSAAPTRMNFPVGSRIRLEDALVILAVKSANDVAVAVAQAVDGSVESFVADMNRRSQEIGLTGSSWRNPHGLHAAGQVTTARDLVILADALLDRFPESARIFSAPGFDIDGKEVDSHNALLGRIDGVDGMKTGYTCASGFNIVTTVTRDGRSLVAVVLGMGTARERDARVAHLLEAAYGASPTDVRLDMLPASDDGAPDMRSQVCGGRGVGAGDLEEAEAEGKSRWEHAFATMPRSLGTPVRMDFLPARMVDVPLPRPRPDIVPEPVQEPHRRRF